MLKTFNTLFLYSALHDAEQTADAGANVSYLRKVLADSRSVDDMLLTSRLGDDVGRALRLETAMRWQPTRVRGNAQQSLTQQRVDLTKATHDSGLFKVRGTCVEAAVGAIYHFRVRPHHWQGANGTGRARRTALLLIADPSAPAYAWT